MRNCKYISSFLYPFNPHIIIHMKSVLQTLFRSKVQPLVEPVPPQEETQWEQQPEEKSKVALQGDISAIAIDDVFQLVGHAGITGELEVLTTGNSGYFFFTKGVLVFGLLDTSQKKIGEILLAEQQITSKQLEECLAIHQEGDRQQRLGHILIQQGYIHPDNLTSSLGRQIKGAFFEALSWKEGTFLFYIDQAPEEDHLLVSERVDHLLLEGMVYIDDNNA